MLEDSHVDATRPSRDAGRRAGAGDKLSEAEGRTAAPIEALAKMGPCRRLHPLPCSRNAAIGLPAHGSTGVSPSHKRVLDRWRAHASLRACARFLGIHKSPGGFAFPGNDHSLLT